MGATFRMHHCCLMGATLRFDALHHGCHMGATFRIVALLYEAAYVLAFGRMDLVPDDSSPACGAAGR